MKAESTIRPAQFEIEKHGEIAVISFYQNIEKIERDAEGQITESYIYDVYTLEVPDREGLFEKIESNYDAWLQLAIEKENEPKLETEKEKVAKLEKENRQLGIEISEREIQEIIQGRLISDLEIQILELQLGGI